MAKKKAAGKDAVKIGIIGGSGLYHMAGLTKTREVRVKTPFGAPSDAIVIGTLEGKQVAFLARHGRGHLFSPSEINYRANIYALKVLGVERILSVSAVGSLRDDMPPMDFCDCGPVLRPDEAPGVTFFSDGIVAHVGFDKPTCVHLSAHIADACERAKVKAQSRRDVCVHGRAAVFDAGGIADVPADAV